MFSGRRLQVSASGKAQRSGQRFVGSGAKITSWPASWPSAQAASNKFGTVGTTNAASTGSSGAAMTALIALVSVGAVVGAAVGLKKRNAGNSGFTAGAAGAPARLEVATRGAAKDDATDIL